MTDWQIWAMAVLIAIPWAVCATMPAVVVIQQMKAAANSVQIALDARANYLAVKAEAQRAKDSLNVQPDKDLGQ